MSRLNSWLKSCFKNWVDSTYDWSAVLTNLFDSTKKKTFESTQFDSSQVSLLLDVDLGEGENRILSSLNWFAQVKGRRPSTPLAMSQSHLTHICLSRFKSDSQPKNWLNSWLKCCFKQTESTRLLTHPKMYDDSCVDSRLNSESFTSLSVSTMNATDDKLMSLQPLNQHTNSNTDTFIDHHRYQNKCLDNSTNFYTSMETIWWSHSTHKYIPSLVFNALLIASNLVPIGLPSKCCCQYSYLFSFHPLLTAAWYDRPFPINFTHQW